MAKITVCGSQKSHAMWKSMCPFNKPLKPLCCSTTCMYIHIYIYIHIYTYIYTYIYTHNIVCSPKIHILYRACSLWSRPHLHGTRLDAIPSQGFWELFTRGQHFFDLQHEDQSEWNHLSGAWKFLSPTSTRWVSVSESPSLSISQLVYDFIAFFHYKFGFSEIGGTPKPSKPWVSILKWSKFGWFRVPPISGNLQIGIAQHVF